MAALHRFLLSCLCLCFATASMGTEIKHSKVRAGSTLDQYAVELLQFLVELNGEKAEMVPFEGSSSQARKELQLKAGELDVDWFGGSQIDENRVQPVRYPIFRGLLGYRVFITNRETARKLKYKMPLEQLQQFHVIQGSGWGDADILKNSGFTSVSTLPDFENLFKVIELGRAELFPRSITEPYGELDSRCHLTAQFVCRDKNMLVDDKLLLVYKFPMYFFVSPKRPDIKHYIENAFRKHYDEFLTFFHKHPLVIESLKRLKGRTVYYLDDTRALSPETKAVPSQYWHSPTDTNIP